MVDTARAFATHHDGIYRYLVRLTGDPDLAADAAQEAFVRFCERPPASQAHLRAWLYRVATNYALDTMRVASRRAELITERPTAALGQPRLVPDEAMERSERRQAVRAALATIRPRERSVLLMRAQGFSYKEISEALEIPVNSVGAVAARGLRKLTIRLAPREAQLR